MLWMSFSGEMCMYVFGDFVGVMERESGLAG